LFLNFHCANSMHTFATCAVASAFARLRAACAIASNLSRVNSHNSCASLSALNSVCGSKIAAPC